MIIAIGNFKGGVGKTTTTSLLSYILANKYDKKILLVDTDQQADLSDEVTTTYKINLDNDKNIYNACFKTGDTKDYIQELSNNVHLLAGSTDMRNFEGTVLEAYSAKSEQELQTYILNYILSEVEDEYDYILLDTNPAVDLLTDNILQASDYVLIPTKSLARDREDTIVFYNYLLDKQEDLSFEILGVLVYLFEDSSASLEIIENYKEVFGHDLFNAVINNSAVVHRWSLKGITNDKPYDKKTLSMYESFTDEFLERIKNLS